MDGGCAKDKINIRWIVPQVCFGKAHQMKSKNLLPQCKALQSCCCSFCTWNHFWELHFYFWLVFTHHSCEHIIDAKLLLLITFNIGDLMIHLWILDFSSDSQVAQ